MVNQAQTTTRPCPDLPLRHVWVVDDFVNAIRLDDKAAENQYEGVAEQ